MANMLGLETDDPGVGTWSLRERTPEGSRLAIDFVYPDDSHTNTTMFLTRERLPGIAITEAGLFTLSGTEKGGRAEFTADGHYVEALQALGQRVFAREMLACGIFQIPLDYLTRLLHRWPDAKMIMISGLFALGITEEEIEAVVADHPTASPNDVMMSVMRSRHSG